MGIAYLAVYFLAVPAAVTFALYKFARLWVWAAPLAATALGTAMTAVYVGGIPDIAGEAGSTFWALLMPAQQLIALSFCLGTLVGMRWGGPLGLAIGAVGLMLGLMPVAVTGLPILLYPVCILLFAAVLILSFTGKARKAWEEYRQGNSPEL